MEERRRLSLYDKAPQMMRDMISGLAGDCPFLLSVRSSDEAASMLVSSLADGAALGFTLEYYRFHGGVWFRYDGRGSDGGRLWRKTEPPFTGVDDILAAERRRRALVDVLTPEEMEMLKSRSRLNTDSHILTGKYRDWTVERLAEEDEQYFRWAIEGLRGFSEMAFK